MLVALDEHGTLVTLRSHEQARRLSGQTFFCPACRGLLRIKNGPQLIAHFAHRDHACAASSEPESETHLAGKWWLAQYGEALGLTVTLETYYAAIQQRADVVWQAAGERPRVLEYQCSPISVTRLRERTEGYRKIGLEVVWIAGPRYFAALPGGKQARFLQWQKDVGFHLWQLDPRRGRLSRLVLTAAAVVQTDYQRGHVPVIHHQEYVEPLAARARAVQAALFHRAPAAMALQAVASGQGLNLGGTPWVVHQQLRHLPGLTAPEWAIRAAWLLTFRTGSIQKAAEAAFWTQYDEVKAPQLPPRALAEAVRRQWLDVLTTSGYLEATADGWRWLRRVPWYATVDEKLRVIDQASKR